MSRYVIIGCGVAGISAAQAIRQVDADGPITLVSGDRHGYYSRPGLAYYLTGEISDSFLFPFSEEQFQNLQVQRVNEWVARICPDEQRIECRSGKNYRYDRLLIATGSSATRPAVAGIELEGVVKLDHLEDARHILKIARKGCTAVVVGGGITALELVEGLTARGVKVHLFLLGDRYWNSVISEEESAIVEARLGKEGVQIHKRTELREIIGHKGKVSGVCTRNGRQIAAQIVAYAIGVKPAIDLAVGCGLAVERGILVNSYLQTRRADIFAAGDAAQVYDPGSQKWIVESLWSTAAAQGRQAGLNMAGQLASYQRSQAVNITRLAGVTTTIIGAIGKGQDDDLLSITHGESETWRDSPEAIVTLINYAVNHVRIMVGENTLLGAVVMGDQGLSPILKELITKKIDISPIRAALIAPDAPTERLIRSYWGQLEDGHAAKGS